MFKMIEHFENLKIYVRLKTYAFTSIFSYEYTLPIYKAEENPNRLKAFNILGTTIDLETVKDKFKIFNINKDNLLSIAVIYHDSILTNVYYDIYTNQKIHIGDCESFKEIYSDEWAYRWVCYEKFNDMNELLNTVLEDIKNPYMRLMNHLCTLNNIGKGFRYIDNNTGYHLSYKSKEIFRKLRKTGDLDIDKLPPTVTFIKKKNLHDKNSQIVEVETKDIFNKFAPLYWKIDNVEDYKIGQQLFVNVKNTKTFIIKEISGKVRKSYTIALDGRISPLLIKKISEKRLKALFATEVGKRDKKNDTDWEKFLNDNGCRFEYIFTTNNFDDNVPYCIKGETIEYNPCFITVSVYGSRIYFFDPSIAFRRHDISAEKYYKDNCDIYPWLPPKMK
jgi:hypothetical protein